ncbi:MAG: hypothetical protein GF313_03690 [Caldithrix sp.]|nr:hypothetical protein [Caldithrix sp.]
MRRFNVKFLLILFIFTGLNYGGDEDRISPKANPHIYRYAFARIGAQNWAAGGAASLSDPVAGAIFHPAAMSGNRFRFDVQVNHRFQTDWLYGYNTDGKTILPTYAGVYLPLDAFNVTVGYYRPYDLYLSTEIELTLEPEGTKEFINIETVNRIHSPFAAISYAVNKQLRIGVNLNLHYLQREESMDRLKSEGHAYGFGLLASIVYRVNDDFEIGLSGGYHHLPEYDLKTDVTSLVGPENDSTAVFVSDESTTPAEGDLPPVVRLNSRYRILPELKLFAGIEYWRWTIIDEDYKNNLELHAGLNYQVLESLSVSLGYAKNNGQFSDPEAYFPSIQPFYEQNILTAGLHYRFGQHLKLNLSVMDSHILKNDDYTHDTDLGKTEGSMAQTIVMANIGYEW